MQWRERLVSALKVMQGEDIGGETATCQARIFCMLLLYEHGL